nr:MAG TPA: hypothetical protein [Caudoviricetes sp.]
MGIQHHIALSRCHSLMAAFVHPRAIHSWALCALLDFHLTPLLDFTVHRRGFFQPQGTFIHA